MKRFMFAATCAAALALGSSASALAQEKIRLIGSGASFPAPIYLTWFKDFSKKTVSVQPLHL